MLPKLTQFQTLSDVHAWVKDIVYPTEREPVLMTLNAILTHWAKTLAEHDDVGRLVLSVGEYRAPSGEYYPRTYGVTLHTRDREGQRHQGRLMCVADDQYLITQILNVE